MEAWIRENLFSFLSVLFGAGSVGYLIINKILNKEKYDQEVRNTTAAADLKGDEFWKKRYEVLEKENKNKDAWWKERYETLYSELQVERGQNNEIFKNFRNQLNEIRNDYDVQIKSHTEKYNKLFSEYQNVLRQSEEESKRFNQRINMLEMTIKSHEERIGQNADCKNIETEKIA